MGWNYLSIPKLQRLHHWSLEMDKQFHVKYYNGWNYLFMLGLKSINFSKRGLNCKKWLHVTLIVRCWRSPVFLFSKIASNAELWYFYVASLDIWWRYQMETFAALLAICVGNSPVPGEFPTQRPVTGSFVVFFDLRLNKPLRCGAGSQVVGDFRHHDDQGRYC